ncbi:MAG: hypothetical protein OXI86_21000, partial [Candidatus Poribacteria bacterium]|nr:hypothetical protein [Candidatus Poribacteria bacterium]
PVGLLNAGAHPTNVLFKQALKASLEKASNSIVNLLCKDTISATSYFGKMSIKSECIGNMHLVKV